MSFARGSGSYPRLATYVPNVETRSRPARSTGELMYASVTKTERSGVLAAIQCDAVSCARLIAISVERRCQIPIKAGENADTIRTAAMIGRGQRLTSQAARIATAIHMIWKYLVMSQ